MTRKISSSKKPDPLKERVRQLEKQVNKISKTLNSLINDIKNDNDHRAERDYQERYHGL